MPLYSVVILLLKISKISIKILNFYGKLTMITKQTRVILLVNDHCRVYTNGSHIEMHISFSFRVVDNHRIYVLDIDGVSRVCCP